MEQYTDEYLSAYLLKQLAPDEAAAFAAALAEDEALQKRTDELRDVVMVAELSHQEHTRELLRTLKTEGQERNTKWWWSGLLLLVVLVGGAWFVANLDLAGGDDGGELPLQPAENSQVTPPNEEAKDLPSAEQPQEEPVEINQEDEPVIRRPPTEKLKDGREEVEQDDTEPPVFAARLSEAATSAHNLPPSFDTYRMAENQDTLSLAFNALQEREPEKAVALLLALGRQGSSTRADHLLAHAYFIQGDFDQSARLFKKLLAAPDGQPDPDGLEWNLLLAILARDNKQGPEADALIRKISDPDAYHNFSTMISKLPVTLPAGEN